MWLPVSSIDNIFKAIILQKTLLRHQTLRALEMQTLLYKWRSTSLNTFSEFKRWNMSKLMPPSWGHPTTIYWSVSGIKTWSPCLVLGHLWKSVLDPESPVKSGRKMLWLHWSSTSPSARSCFIYSLNYVDPESITSPKLLLLKKKKARIDWSSLEIQPPPVTIEIPSVISLGESQVAFSQTCPVFEVPYFHTAVRRRQSHAREGNSLILVAMELCKVMN